MSQTIFQILFASIVAVLSLGASGCNREKAAARAGGGPASFAVQVIAVVAKRQPVSESLSLIGNIVANEIVEIKAEAEGIVEQINFNEGQKVEKGTLILKLDETRSAASL